MIFPYIGCSTRYSKEGVILKGMCLFCGEPGKIYTVKFAPGDLWAMEV